MSLRKVCVYDSTVSRQTRRGGQTEKRGSVVLRVDPFTIDPSPVKDLRVVLSKERRRPLITKLIRLLSKVNGNLGIFVF